MWEAITQIWFLIAILPFIIFLEGDKKFADFLKRKNIYAHWDVYHSFLVVAVAVLAVFLMQGHK